MPTTENEASDPKETNPLLEAWAGPLGGVPPFSRVQVEHFKPALEQAMTSALAEVNRIAAQPDPPSFDNTLAALERASHTLDRVRAVYNVWTSSLQTPEVQAVEREMGPKLAAFSDQITQNSALFARITAVYETRESAGLTPEQQRLAWVRYDHFVRTGAKLDAPSKTRLAEINQRLAALFTTFGQNVVADESNQFVLIEQQADLIGLPMSFQQSAAAEAVSRGHAGKWVISNTRSSVAPFLTYSDRRDLREKVWKMFVDRGDSPGATDNNPIITEILSLRAERAKLLGYPTHAHWRMANTMAKTPDQAIALLERVWKPAVSRVREEVRDMQAFANKELGQGKIRIEPWDYRYYGEKVRKQKYDLDGNQVKSYLQLDKLREAMFWVAGELHGLQFTRADNVKGFHPDVTAWKVSSTVSGSDVGMFFFDPWARQGKRSGAWASAYRLQQRFDGDVRPIVSNNSNFMKGAANEPTLVSWDDAETLFHEFGHALHGLLSNVQYPSLAGTQVFRDYVEFPSQINEHWLATPEVLQRFALHYQTGEPIPASLVQRIENASTFNQGFDTVEFLASAMFDMRVHLVGADSGVDKIDPRTFERETLAKLGMPKEIVMRHRSPHFQHIFGSDSYSAGYYSYLWADVLTADAFQAFVEAGGPYDRAVAARLRDNVLSQGNTVDPAEGYRRFRGRDAHVDALMKKRGFPTK